MLNKFSLKATACVLSLSLLALIGCDKADKQTKEKPTPSTVVSDVATQPLAIPPDSVTTTSTTQTTTTNLPSLAATSTTGSTSNANTNTVAARHLINKTMRLFGSTMVLANQYTLKKSGKEKFTQQQIECVVNHDNDAATSVMQGYFQQNFTPDEIQQLNKYYSSKAGEKEMELADNLATITIAEAKGQKAVPELKLTAQEEKDMKNFLESPIGKKYQAVLIDKEKRRAVMTQIMTKKADDCKLPN